MTAGQTFGAVVAIVLAGILSGCGSAGVREGGLTVRIGMSPNVTHASGLIAAGRHYFEKELPGAKVEISSFPSGTTIVEALFSNAVDVAYLGPNPAINGYAQSDGAALRVVSGATSGGAALVVRTGITTAQDLRGKTLASPSLGNTQDVALRWYLRGKGLNTDVAGGGDVSIVPQENSQTLQTFRSGTIDGAWVPEPWATRLVKDGGGHVLVSERDLWPDGNFVTTQVVVARRFLTQHPDAVRGIVAANLDGIDFARAHGSEAQTVSNDEIESFTGKRLKDPILAAAWGNLMFTPDPVASSLRRSADNAIAVGLLKPVRNLPGLYDLDILNALLRSKGRPPVKGLS